MLAYKYWIYPLVSRFESPSGRQWSTSGEDGGQDVEEGPNYRLGVELEMWHKQTHIYGKIEICDRHTLWQGSLELKCKGSRMTMIKMMMVMKQHLVGRSQQKACAELPTFELTAIAAAAA